MFSTRIQNHCVSSPPFPSDYPVILTVLSRLLIAYDQFRLPCENYTDSRHLISLMFSRLFCHVEHEKIVERVPESTIRDLQPSLCCTLNAPKQWNVHGLTS